MHRPREDSYRPGDEIYVFGFSRGAYSARSFVGLLRKSGIVNRRIANKITAAIANYKSQEIEVQRKFRNDCVTAGREIENYLPLSSVNSLLPDNREISLSVPLMKRSGSLTMVGKSSAISWYVLSAANLL
jgi:hypothetical protein